MAENNKQQEIMAPSADVQMAQVPGAEDAVLAEYTAPVAKKKKRNVKKIIFASIGALIVLVIGFNIVSGILQGPPATYVEVQAVTKGEVKQTLSTAGTLKTGEEITVFAPVGAPVTEVNAVAGSRVQQGQELFGFDTVLLERNYRQASASRGLASTQVNEAHKASNDAAKSMADEKANIDNLQIQRDNAIKARDDIQAQIDALGTANNELLAQLAALEGAGASEAEMAPVRQQIEDNHAAAQALGQALSVAEADVQTQKSMLSAANQTYLAAEKGVLTADGKKGLELQQVAPQVGLEMASSDLEAARAGVKAPISGIVTAVNAQEGGMVTQYSPLCVIQSLDKVDVIVALSRYDLERVKEGQPAMVTSVGKEYPATVTKIDAMATTVAGTTGATTAVNATISLQNPDENLRLGVEANVEIQTGNVTDVITVPVSAVNTDVDGSFCFVMENGLSVRRAVELGLSSDTMVEVTSGLQEGDQVILSSQNLVEGLNLTTDPAKAPAGSQGMMGMMVG